MGPSPADRRDNPGQYLSGQGSNSFYWHGNQFPGASLDYPVHGECSDCFQKAHIDNRNKHCSLDDIISYLSYKPEQWTGALCKKALDFLPAADRIRGRLPYTFRTHCNITQWNMALAYYFSKKPARKFSIICQDYMYGHSMGEAFKKYLNKYKPEAEIVSEDYHQLWLKDFAPYLSKVMAADPDVLYTGDWLPDGDNLLKQARALGLNGPVANIYITNPATLSAVGIKGSRNMIYCFPTIIGDSRRTEAQKTLMRTWNQLWKTWEAPYDNAIYKWPDFIGGQTISDTYWLFDVIARAGSTDPEKIIQVWEGDVYDSIQGIRTMRAEDHQAIFDIYVAEGTHPTQEVYPGQPYSENYAGVSEIFTVPQKYCTPPIPAGLKDRLK